MADSSNQAGHRAFNPVMRVRAPYPLPVGRRTTEVRQIVALKMRVRLSPINPYGRIILIGKEAVC